MTDAGGRFHSTFAFERHPASIERHADQSAAIPAAGFDGITTWSPYMLGEVARIPNAEPPTELAALEPPPEARQHPVEPVVAPEPAPLLAETIHPPPLPTSPQGRAEPETGWRAADHAEASASPGPAMARAPVRPALPPLLRPSAPAEPNGLGMWEGGLVSLPAWSPLRSRPGLPRLAAGIASAAAVVGLVVAAARYLPGLLSASQAVTAVFNAPMMVVRSAAAGRVVTVAAAPSQMVEPESPLLTIRMDDGREDRPVLAGVHGMIRSVETVPGAALVAGAPLVRLQDCDRAFLTVSPAAKLQAGQTVQVTMPDQKPLVGKVRPSSGVMEPPDSLVIGLDPGVLTASCPVGHSASVTPVQG